MIEFARNLLGFTVYRMGYWSEYREVAFELFVPIDCENKCVINDSNDFESTGLRQLLAVSLSVEQRVGALN